MAKEPLEYSEALTYQAYYSELEAVSNFIRGKAPDTIIFALFIDNEGNIFPATQLQKPGAPDSIYTDRKESGRGQLLQIANVLKKDIQRNELSFKEAKKMALSYKNGNNRLQSINLNSTRHPRYK